MHPQPLTPPSEDSAEATYGHRDDAVGLTNGSGHDEVNPNHPTSIPTPESCNSMAYDNPEEVYDTEGEDEQPNTFDEDQDMSEGGAALTMTLSHAEELNAEMDLLDSELMGHDNLVDLHFENYQPQADLPFHNTEHLQNLPAILQNFNFEAFLGHHHQHQAANAANLPAVMSEVSQQLQHIQDGQDHEDIGAAADEQVGVFMETSTAPLPFPSVLMSVATIGVHEHANHGSMAVFTSLNQLPPTLGLPIASHMWVAEDSSFLSGLDSFGLVESDLVISQLPSSDPIWDDDESDADHLGVQDQFNLHLGEFLHQWASVAAARKEDSKRHRTGGPSLVEVVKQRTEKNLEPIERENLQGDFCDIQRINWKDLGVSRLEARQMRRQTYKNYTNLRFKPTLHVSPPQKDLSLLHILTKPLFVATPNRCKVRGL